MKVVKLFGVAGAGKTTKCLEYIKGLIVEYDISEICFTTFTKAGIKSIVEKLNESGIELPEKTHYFRTMHSLTWKLSGFYSDNMLKEKHKKVFFDEHNVSTVSTFDEEKSESDIVMDLYNYVLAEECRFIDVENDINIIRRHINTLWANSDFFMNKDRAINILIKFCEWKDKNQYKTFIDSIIHCIKYEIDIPCKVLIVDEAQDLSPAEIKLVKMWVDKFEKNRTIFILAGDDDQCVHEWKGADPDFLIHYTHPNMDEVILDKSFRLPQKAVMFNNIILNSIKNRRKKTINSDNEKGEVLSADMDEYGFIKGFKKEMKNFSGTTFVLCRTNRIRNDIADLLFNETNYTFGFLGTGYQSRWTNKFINICNVINKICYGYNSLTQSEVKNLFDILLAKECLVRGAKNQIKNTKPTKIFSRGEVMKMMRFPSNMSGSQLKNRIIRYTTFVANLRTVQNINKNELYRRKVMNTDDLIEKPENGFDLQLGTYHNSKGLEADNVFVVLGTNDYFRDINDSERRCFYVACSRVKKNLLIVGTKGFPKYKPWLQDEFDFFWRKYVKNGKV